MNYYEQLGLESSELASVIRDVLKNGFVKNPSIKGLNRNQKQLLAYLVVYLFVKISYQVRIPTFFIFWIHLTSF